VDFELSAEHELIRRTVREFAEGEVAPVAEELDRTKSFPYEIVTKLGKLNLMGIPFPAQYGGAGADTLAYALAVEELTRVDSSVAITLCAHTSLGTQPSSSSAPRSSVFSGCPSCARGASWEPSA
jgi:alkylation response protein AidB-like acyl-CoA dehydrogenase